LQVKKKLIKFSPVLGVTCIPYLLHIVHYWWAGTMVE